MNVNKAGNRRHGNGQATQAVSGMRGGLGRILLTAFMLLAIVPLSIVSFLAIKRVRANMRQAAADSVALVAASVASQVQSWLGAQQYGLGLVAESQDLRKAVSEGDWGAACGLLRAHTTDSLPLSLVLDTGGAEGTPCTGGAAPSPKVLESLSLTVPLLDQGDHSMGWVVGYPDLSALGRVATMDGASEDTIVFLVDESGDWVLLSPHDTALPDLVRPFTETVPLDHQGASGFYENAFGQAVVGARRWLPGSPLTMLVEQSQETLLAKEDDLAAVLIGSTLAVALLTAVLAAVITRQLTRPIVDLTMSAVRIAGGDLDQTVELDRRDEIGILARAFNIMTAELASLYTDLEKKVAERTSQLTEANLELRYKAMQLKLSAEVGRVATSILDPDLLLRRVTELVLDAYAHVYDVYYVAILLQDEFGEGLERQARSARDLGMAPPSANREAALAEQTARDGVFRSLEIGDGGVQVVIPLCIGTRAIGSLDLRCFRPDILGPDDVEVLQGLGDQISVAIENARLYAIEREAAQRLSRLDDLRLASLGVGSRELATELNTIIGFSRLILKEADGPLTDLQRADLVAIYKSGYKLLGLIDNVITLSELEGGSYRLAQKTVDTGDLLSDVLTTARQRLVTTTVEWRGQEALPSLHGDVSLLRQAFLSLVAAAAEQVPRNKVAVRAQVAQDASCRLVVRFGDQDFVTGRDGDHMGEAHLQGEDAEEMGVGLALAREIIALHRGETVLRLDVERGLDVAVTLPIRAGAAASQ